MTDRPKRAGKKPGRSRGVIRGMRQEVRRREVSTLNREELEDQLRKEIKRRRDAEKNLSEAWSLASLREISIRSLTNELERIHANPVARASVALSRRAQLGSVLRLGRHHVRRALMGAFKVGLNDYNHYEARPIALPAAYSRKLALNNPPKISVVTPSYNSADFIAATMHSVLDQGYPNLEYICQDGASKDGTAKIIKSFEDRLHHWASERDSGFTQAINRGFSHATGDIMAWLNSDDLFLPGSLAYVARYFAAHPEVDVVYGHRIIIDAQDREIGRWIVPPHSDTAIKYADYIPQETMFWRRSIWEKSGGELDEAFNFAIDWDLILRFQEAGATFKRLPRFLGAFRAHEAQKSQAAIASVGHGEMDILRERALGYAPDHAEIAKIVRRYKLHHAILSLRNRIRAR